MSVSSIESRIERINSIIRSRTNVSSTPIHDLYLKPSEEFITNNRNQCIHVRSVLPNTRINGINTNNAINANNELKTKGKERKDSHNVDGNTSNINDVSNGDVNDDGSGEKSEEKSDEDDDKDDVKVDNIAEPDCLLISLHGYSAHNNAPWVSVIADECKQQNIGFITFDFHGHGYSEGIPVDVVNYHDLIDDCMSLIVELYSPSSSTSSTTTALDGTAPGASVASGDINIRSASDAVDDNVGTRVPNTAVPTNEPIPSSSPSSNASSIANRNRSGKRSNLLRRGFKCPFFITGMSLGGVTALATCLELQDIRNHVYAYDYGHCSGLLHQEEGFASRTGDKKDVDKVALTEMQQKLLHIAHYFAGGIFLCPAISLVLPHWTVLSFIEHCIVPCFPLSPTPKIGPDLDPSLVFFPEFLEFAEKDNVASDPPGMTYAPLIRYRTGLSVLNMTKYVQDRLHDIQFPFLVFHDPGDAICTFDGTERLVNESITPSSQKELVTMPGSLHGLIPNCTGQVLLKMFDWMEQRVESFTVNPQINVRSLDRSDQQSNAI